MEIITYEKQTWQEIPEQDNPAMQYHKFSDGLRRPEELIMIFKDGRKRISPEGFVVAHVPLTGDITSKGVFWTVENAQLFADALAQNPSEIFPGTNEALDKLSI